MHIVILHQMDLSCHGPITWYMTNRKKSFRRCCNYDWLKLKLAPVCSHAQMGLCITHLSGVICSLHVFICWLFQKINILTIVITSC